MSVYTTIQNEIARKVWNAARRTLVTGTPGTPTNRAERMAESVWTATTRDRKELGTRWTAYWKLDEASGADAIDAKGSETLTQNNTVGSGGGVVSPARTFNGTNQYFDHADDAALSTGDIDFSWSGWVKPSSLTGTHTIFRKGNSGATTREYALYTSGTTLTWEVGNGSAVQTVSWGTALATGNW